MKAMTARQRQALTYFVSVGWTLEQAAGITANLFAESGLDPAAVGDGGQAYGIAQWHSDRQAGFTALMGKQIQGSSFEDQLAWVHAELQSTERAAGDALRACTNATAAGACISKLYERPADREGEATRRGALAEEIFESSRAVVTEQPAAPIEDHSTTLPQPEKKPMGAIALPLLAQLVPQILALFSGRAQAQIAKATGASPDAAAQFMQSLIGQVGQVAGIPVTDATTATQAVAAVTAMADPAAKAAAVQQLEDHSLDYLDKIGPMVDRLAAIDAAQAAADVAGRNAAAQRAQGERWDMTPWLIWFAGATSSLLVLSLLGAIIYQAVSGDKKIDTALIGIAGPLLAISMGVWREIFAYRFDGNSHSTAADFVKNQVALNQNRTPTV